jgi:hypothetical protein
MIRNVHPGSGSWFFYTSRIQKSTGSEVLYYILVIYFELLVLFHFELPVLFHFELPVLLFPFELPVLFPFELPVLFPLNYRRSFCV